MDGFRPESKESREDTLTGHNLTATIVGVLVQASLASAVASTIGPIPSGNPF
jgi:hypothetical protein